MYFPIRGRCEHIRLIFAAGGLEVNDVRVPSSDWPELKPSEFGLDLNYEFMNTVNRFSVYPIIFIKNI